MSPLLSKTLLLSVPLLLTPLLASGQSSTNFSFSASQLCSLDDFGQLQCIVSQGYERILPPSNIPALGAVTTGQSHACGITLDGQPACWGENNFGQLNVPTVNAPLVQINAGADHTCAIDSNAEVTCWGLNTNLQLEPPEGATFTQVDAAQLESCGILTDGELVCWSDDPRRSPQDLAGPFVKIDLRSGAVCGLMADGQIQCADNSTAVVPIRPIPPYIVPPDNGPYVDLAASRNAVCGLQLDGALDCTFRDAESSVDYPLGEQFVSIESNETDILVSTRTFIDGAYTYVTSGTAMCGKRTDGSIECWDRGAVFPSLDGPTNSNADLVQSMEFDLDARVYGSGTVEIFWTPLPFSSLGDNQIPEPIVEVYRNGEIIADQVARFSYFDRRAVTEADYQIRLIDQAGNPGPLSGILSVNTAERTVLFNGEPTLLISQQDVLPNVFTDIRAVDLFEGIVIAWQVNADIESTIDGYEIQVNGAPAGFTRSKLFVETTTPFAGRCVEIIAVGFDQSLIGARTYGNGCNS